MAIVFQDGFDYMKENIGDFATVPGARYMLKPEWQPHATLGGTINDFQSPGAYGIGRYAMQVYTMGITVPQRSTYIAGFHFYPNTTTATNATLMVAFMRNGNVQCGLGWNHDTQTISFWRGAGSVNLGTLPGIFPTQRWYHIEVKATVNSSTGSFSVNVDGIPAMTVTGLNTQSQGDALVDNVMFQYSYAGTTNLLFNYDNIVILNTDGSLNNDLLGESVVRCYYPSGAGSSTDFTPTPSTNANWQNVNQTSPDLDATYNASNSIGAEDLFPVTAPAGGTNIRAVDVCAIARRDDVGLRTLHVVSKVGGTPYESADAVLSYIFSTAHQLQELNPNTTAQWVVSDFSTAQFGYKVQA